jgi:steroid 5-alpha reductase family enzyme
MVLVGFLIQPGVAGWIMIGCVVMWSGRMAWFLVGRIRRQGKDGRFDTIKTDPIRFLNAWMMQAIWAFLCLLPVLVRLEEGPSAPPSSLFWMGLCLWACGFLIEVVSDEQKRGFRIKHPDGNQFIRNGLWSISRHPNYVGEILLWTGVTVMAVPVVSGWQWIVLITPIFVYSLLRFVSGVPLLEARSDARWGGREDYERYKDHTPVLFPLPWRR